IVAVPEPVMTPPGPAAASAASPVPVKPAAPPAAKPAAKTPAPKQPAKGAAPIAPADEGENRELSGPRWENFGMGVGSFFWTTLQVWTAPRRTFRNLSAQASMLPATWYMLVMLIAATLLHGCLLYELPNDTLDRFGLKDASIFFKVAAHDLVGATL